jgi:hypothetical protein
MAVRKRSKTVRKAAKGAKKTASRAVQGAKKTASKAAQGAKKAASGAVKRAKKVASNPKRTVRRAADKVHTGATRARKVGDSMVTAGEIIRETADLVDALSQRAKGGARTGTRSRKAR